MKLPELFYTQYLLILKWVGVLVLLVYILFSWDFLTTFSFAHSADAATQTLTTRADFKKGFFSGTDAESKEGQLNLKADGTWNARVWRTPYLTLSDGTTFTSDDQYTYMLIGGDTRFVRYLPLEDRWQKLASAPHMPYRGADMTVVGDYIYVSFGGYQKDFSRYSLITNTWEELADLPDLVNSGSSLSTDGTSIYATRGTATTDFWKYSPSTNTWVPLTNPPATLSTGADLIFDDSTGTQYLYTPRGGNTNTMYRYDILGDVWSTMTNAPATLNDNGNLVKFNGNIYVLRGSNTNTFYRYNIENNSWITLSDTPAANRYVGLTYNKADGKLYVFRGNNTYDWWKYDIDTDTFDGISDLPATPGTGADLVYSNGLIYYRRGANSTSFYSLNPATSNSAWTSLAAAPATFNDDTKGATASGNLYFLRGSSQTSFYRYNISGNSWTTLANTPATIGYGASLAYPGSGDYIYSTRGGVSGSFYRYSISSNTWDDSSVADLPSGYTTGYGSRIVSDSQNIYLITGNGAQNILKYDINSNSWTVMNSVPFAPYYGTDMVYYNGKIYAQAGQYKTDFWEYTISTNTWRKLIGMPGYYAQDVGSYNGGSIASTNTGTFYMTSGASISRLVSYSVSPDDYPTSGTWTSDSIDLAYVESWNSLSVSTITPGDSSVIVETRSSSNKSNWSDWQTLSGEEIQSDVLRYLQVKVTLLSSTDRMNTPTVTNIELNYTGDTVAPSPPNTFVGLSQQVGGSTLTSGNNYPYTSPYFSWSGAADSQTAIDGYYVYFGTNSEADPQNLGNFQVASNYSVTTPLSTGSYYLRVKSRDKSGNMSTIVSGFTYVYAGISPPTTATFTDTQDFNGETENISVEGNQIRLSGKEGFWEQERLSAAPSTINYGAGFAKVESTNKLYTFRGLNSTAFYEYDIATDTWSTRSSAPLAVYQGGDIVEGPDGYLYGIPGRNLNTFWRYDIANDTWSDESAADAPTTFYYGSSMVYDGSRYIYVLRGNNDDAFYRYDTQSDTWDSLANTDFGATENQLNNNVNLGGDLAYDGGDLIYAIQGNNYTGMSVYSISSNTWSVLGNLPVLPYDGSQIGYDQESNSLFFISGWSNPFFYQYDLGSQTWIELAQSPAPFGAGAAMRISNGILYMLRGASTNSFWKYNIEKASWKVPTVGLFGTEFRGTDYRPFGYGAQIVKGDGTFYYLTRGNYDNLFVRYDEVTGESVQMADAPVGFYSGSSIAYDTHNNKIYVIGSQYVQKLFVYDIPTDTWSEVQTDPLPNTSGVGSSLVYDHNRYLYWNRGSSSTLFYRYDTQASAGNRWSAVSSVPGSLGYGAHLEYVDGYIYTLRGANVNPNPLYRYNTNDDTWSTLASLEIDVNNDGTLVYGGNGYLYACKAENTALCYQYSIDTNEWESIADAPANIFQGGASASNEQNRMFVIAGAGGTNTYTNGLYTYVFQSENSSFEEEGVYTSPVHDLSAVYKYANLAVTYTQMPNTDFSIETRSSEDNDVWSTWTAASDEKKVGDTYTYEMNSPASRYVQVRFTFTSSDGVYSGAISDYSFTLYQDTQTPSNPTSLHAYTSSTQSAILTTNTWNHAASPYFVWPQAEQEDGASDTNAGSGVTGYYVYFGTDADADPELSGTLQSSVTYTASNLSSGSIYYLRIKAVDAAGNIAGAVWQPFIYKFDNVAPENPTTVTADPPGYTATNSFDFAWSGATDSASGVADYCYKTLLAGSEICGVEEEEVLDVVAGGTGASTFYVRARDGAGNKAAAFVSVSYYYSATAPSAPRNLQATPTSNSINEFAFSWSPPEIFFGAQASIRYYYSINALPTPQNVNQVGLTTTYLSAGAYATVPGNNILYVLAKDEAGNIDYNNYSQVVFTADTSAPGVIRNIDISDVSVKATKNWRLAVSWDAPLASGSGVASYRVYRVPSQTAVCTTNFDEFRYVASTTTDSYVDTGLTQEPYAYCIKACDSTNNCSAVSDTVSLTPDGKWTEPPVLTASPSAIFKTKSATISWSTDRTSNSFVKFGTKSGEYGDEVGSSDQVAAHIISLSGLEPGTPYFYKTLWTDEDGNTGESEEGTFTTDPAPVISEVKMSNVSLYTAYVNFKIKNATKATVKFGKTVSYGGIESIATSKNEAVYTVVLSDLTEGTAYNLQIVAEDDEGNLFASDNYTFETLPVPKVTASRVTQVAGQPTATVRVVWSTNTPVSSIVTYYPSATPSLAQDQITLALKKSHQMILRNLRDDQEYTIVIKGKDSAGNDVSYSPMQLRTALDFRAPEISNLSVESTVIGVGDEARAQVIVSWDTDEPGSTQVEYGEGTSGNYSQKTQEDANLTTNHIVTLSGLSPAEIYSIRALSKDKADNKSTSQDTVVVTPRSTKSAFNIVIENLSKTFKFLDGI